MIDHDALDEIEDGYCTGFGMVFPELSKTYVPGEGDNPQAFIIGEAPGAQEEVRRRPFVGPAGRVLRDLMGIADLNTEDQYADGRDSPPTAGANCWLTNTVKFRPPKNRNPTELEIKAARPWLTREWKAVGSPQLIIPVGKIALYALYGRWMSILKVAGKCRRETSKRGFPLYVWPMVHPSFGLYNKAVQPLLEKDWETLAAWRDDVGI